MVGLFERQVAITEEGASYQGVMGSLAFSVQPAGSTRNASGTRTLLHFTFLGTCRRHGGAAQ